jgi:hypothetical protein
MTNNYYSSLAPSKSTVSPGSKAKSNSMPYCPRCHRADRVSYYPAHRNRDLLDLGYYDYVADPHNNYDRNVDLDDYEHDAADAYVLGLNGVIDRYVAYCTVRLGYIGKRSKFCFFKPLGYYEIYICYYEHDNV